jgi:hypothetical protein
MTKTWAPLFDDLFALDRQWICATNELANQVNNDLQQWKSQEPQSLDIVSAFTGFIKPLSNYPGFSEAEKIDFLERIDIPDLLRRISTFSRGSVHFA